MQKTEQEKLEKLARKVCQSWLYYGFVFVLLVILCATLVIIASNILVESKVPGSLLIIVIDLSE